MLERVERKVSRIAWHATSNGLWQRPVSQHVVIGTRPEAIMNWRDHIVSDPEVLAGKPVIKGTRVSVQLVLERLADG